MMMSEDPTREVKTLLSKIPCPPEGSDEALARNLIDMVLNCMLNRYIHVLDDNGYLKSRKHSREHGWKNGKPNKALQIKFDLMDEAIERFSRPIVEELATRRNSSQ